MAAVSTSPPPVAPSSNNATSPRRKPLNISSIAINGEAAQIRHSPVSPVKISSPQETWPEPSNANIEDSQPRSPQFELADRTRNQGEPAPHSNATKLALSHEAAHAENLPLEAPGSPATRQPRPTEAASHGNVSNFSFPVKAGPRFERNENKEMNPTQRIRLQEGLRSSQESEGASSLSQQPASIKSSAPTSVSSGSGLQEGPDYRPGEDSAESSIIEGNLPGSQSVPQFQYHHQQDNDMSSSNPELRESAPHPRRHLTPTSHYLNSLSRPRSTYSLNSDLSRGRSPALSPGSGSQFRSPSTSSRKSPDVRNSTYAELLSVPYPQQAPPAIGLDNSDLRGVIGNNASLLSTQKTLEMYRQNVKKTNDASIQYSFAVFLISFAQEQGLDWSDTKSKKSGPSPFRDHDSPIIETQVTSPIELVKEAKHILQRLANGGYPFAQYYLADGFASGLFNKGRGDANSAFPLFVLAAKHGHAESAYRTGLCYEFGWGCRKDAMKAVQFLRTAAAKRHPGAMTRLGKACLSGDLGEKRYREGIKWLKLATESADNQYNHAPYQLGCLYETGYGDDIFQDHSYAANLFTQAADLGHPEANYRMGDAYEHGRLSCPKDPALSVHFYTGAAEKEHPAAMMGLCAWYMVGASPILERDEEEAYEWARRSAELGYVKAEYAVGYFTEMGIGCRRDVLEANVWYVKAADSGDERAKQRLAIIQAAVSGEGIPMDVAAPKSGKLGKAQKEDEKDCVIM